MKRTSRRIGNGFGYSGFGNNQSVFNQSSRRAFSSLKDKLNSETHLHFELDFLHKKLTKEEKETIKNKIRKSEKRKSIRVYILASFLLIIFLVFLKILVTNIMNKA
ncbi:hypothetical protein [Neotamlana laminarinivorans]|uniref:Uncharacterized protein n=1 Tax=Neotamlana laminarinivorans TaxID=2883124 RepID=A0A9X1L0P0_9FLAO|nr:hypothetical protein [Tamlana laminarinivorans]MCB4797790.1 hypothetical protein [Tamlana laminarinivorans]